jgi:hypothetical protein
MASKKKKRKIGEFNQTENIDTGFNLPNHGTAEECVEEYMEVQDEHGNYIQKDIVPTSETPQESKHNYSTDKGVTFSETIDFQKHTETVKSKTIYDKDGRKKIFMKAPKTAWVHNLIYLNGEKFDFTGREYLFPIYNAPHKEILLKTGRQVEKSTMLANNLTIMCAMLPFFRCMYVSPSHVQTRTFSNDKLKPVLERSPMIARYLQDNKVSNQVFEKGFTNGAFIFLRSAFLSADRARGISSDLLCLDEIQDLIMSNIPVIAQCLSHSKYQFHLYAGTPKTFDNTIEQFWENTTQNEWMVPCSKCSPTLGKKWNFLDVKNIGKRGPICKFCGADLDVTAGQWQAAQAGKRMKGFRIPQLMVPWIAKKDGDPWKTLVHELETYPESQFYNEVLGLSYDNAAKPITRADLLMNCDSNHHFVSPTNVPDETRRMILFAGVDWGEGNDGTGKDVMGKIRTASYTILTIGGQVGNHFKVIYIKKYKGKEIDPEYIVQDIVKTCKAFGVRMIGVDWGHGWGVNNRLFRMYGPDRCVQFMYVDSQKEVRKWDPVGYKFQLMRNHVMSEIFFKFKEQEFIFPPFEEWEEFAKDILNISVEYVEYQRKLRYIHRPSDPDDFFHSLLYCKQVSDIYYGKR